MQPLQVKGYLSKMMKQVVEERIVQGKKSDNMIEQQMGMRDNVGGLRNKAEISERQRMLDIR